jgi:hypothetical protein
MQYLFKSATLIIVILLTGCASINAIDSDISTYSQWPAHQAPKSYFFERLPSQQNQNKVQDRLEAAAKPSLETAGFQAAADAQSAQVMVQLFIRTTPIEPPRVVYPRHYHQRPWPYTRPYIRYDHWHHPFDPMWHAKSPFFDDEFPSPPPRLIREVVLIMRERKSQQTVYEAHATTQAYGATSDKLLAALFKAALIDFPNEGVNPRSVSVMLDAPVSR